MATTPPFFCCHFFRGSSMYDAKFVNFLDWAAGVDRGIAWVRTSATREPDLEYAIAFRHVENGELELRYFALNKTPISTSRPRRHVEVTEEEVERAGLARTGRCVKLRCEHHDWSFCLEIHAVDNNVEETSEE